LLVVVVDAASVTTLAINNYNDTTCSNLYDESLFLVGPCVRTSTLYWATYSVGGSSGNTLIAQQYTNSNCTTRGATLQLLNGVCSAGPDDANKYIGYYSGDVAQFTVYTDSSCTTVRTGPMAAKIGCSVGQVGFNGGSSALSVSGNSVTLREYNASATCGGALARPERVFTVGVCTSSPVGLGPYYISIASIDTAITPGAGSSSGASGGTGGTGSSGIRSSTADVLSAVVAAVIATLASLVARF